MGFLGLFSDEKHSNSTSTTNSSDTFSNSDSHDSAFSSSYNSTYSSTDTTTQDRRLVADNGAFAVSADNSTLTTTNSNNTTNNNINNSTSSNQFAFDSGNTVGSHNVTTTQTYNSSTDYGAIAASGQLGVQSVASNQALASLAIDASKYLVGTTADMHQANLSFAQHVSDGGAELAWKLSSAANAESRNAIREVAAYSGNVMNQLASVVSKPLDANDPQRLVIIVGLCVVGLVFFSKMRA